MTDTIQPPSVPLACPACGSVRLRSDEVASLGYPVTLARAADGTVEVTYTGDGYETYDENTVYTGDLWCRDCCTQITEDVLAPLVDEDHDPADCSDPGCPAHGIAASNARQSDFYAANDRTVDARPDEAVCGHCQKTVEVVGGWLEDHELGARGSELCNGSGSTPAEDDGS